MERTCPHVESVVTEHAFESLFKLGSGFVRKRYSHYLPRSGRVNGENIAYKRINRLVRIKISLHELDILFGNGTGKRFILISLSVFYKICNSVDKNGCLSAASTR